LLRIRVASAAVGLALLFVVMWAGQIVLGLAVFLLSVIALGEFYKALENVGYKPIKIIGFAASLPVVFLSFEDFSINLGDLINIENMVFFIFLITVILFSLIVFWHNKYNIIDICVTFLGIIYTTFMFSFLLLIRNMDNGFFHVWLVFIAAFATDTFAYFSGRFFGKRKLLPAISPKKTLEGAIGGTLGCVLVTILYGVYLKSSHSINEVSLLNFAVIGLFCSIISQLGDWAASSIKRFAKIKDYGNLIPGHGGVLDRFDSILFTAPLVYFYFKFMIF